MKTQRRNLKSVPIGRPSLPSISNKSTICSRRCACPFSRTGPPILMHIIASPGKRLETTATAQNDLTVAHDHHSALTLGDSSDRTPSPTMDERTVERSSQTFTSPVTHPSYLLPDRPYRLFPLSRQPEKNGETEKGEAKEQEQACSLMVLSCVPPDPMW